MPAILSAADQCYELIIRAKSDDVRNLSAHFCALVLTTYFRGKNQVIIQKLKFVLANLTTNKTQSRRSILLFLKHFIEYGNEHQLESTHDLIFIYLGAAIANESDEQTSKEISELVQELILSNNQSKISSDFPLMTKWAESDGKQTRTGLLLLSAAIALTPESALVELENLVDERLKSDNQKICLAAIHLHKAIVSTFSETEDVRLFSAQQILSLIRNKETCRVGCELSQWYLSDYGSKFKATKEEILDIAEELTRVTFDWSGVISESGLALSIILSQLDSEELNSFVPKLERYAYLENNQENAILLFMRSIVACIDQREPLHKEHTEEEEEKENENEEREEEKRPGTPPQFLRFALKYIGKQKDSKNKQLKKAGTTALNFLRNRVDATLFAEEWSSIVDEDDKHRKERMEQTAADKLLDPEALRAKRREQRQQKKIEKRKKKYLEDDMFDGTLYPYGPDGKPVEKVELPFIFHKSE